ncbi:UNVERIFIED_CONTAM: hypothetical protein FKN15_003287 [Acipenser sinensis]
MRWFYTVAGTKAAAMVRAIGGMSTLLILASSDQFLFQRVAASSVPLNRRDQRPNGPYSPLTIPIEAILIPALNIGIKIETDDCFLERMGDMTITDPPFVFMHAGVGEPAKIIEIDSMDNFMLLVQND